MRQFTKENVKTIRFILGASQQEFANIIGVSQGLIYQIENGHKRITENVNSKIHAVVFHYIDKETLYKILDGELEV